MATPRTPAEIQAEIDRLEKLLPTLRRQFAQNSMWARIDALKWALGQPTAFSQEGSS